MKNYIYKNEYPTTFGKKAKAYLLDLIFIILLSVVFSMAAVSIGQTTNTYKTSENTVTEQIKVLNGITNDARLSSYKDEETKELNSFEEMYGKYLYGHILLSYQNNTAEFNAAGVTDLENNEKIVEGNYKAISLDSDYLAYFYVNYLPSLKDKEEVPSYGELTPVEYFKTLLKSKLEDQSVYDFTNDYVTFSLEAAINVAKAQILEQDCSAGTTANANIYSAFEAVFNNSADIIQKFNLYQEPYNIYFNNYIVLVRIVCLCHIIAFTIAFVILNVILPLFFKGGRTLGKLISGLVVASYEEKNMSVLQGFLRNLIEYFVFFGAIFVSAFFTTGTNSLVLELFKIGNMSVNLLLILSIAYLFGAINLIVCYSKKDKRSVVDLASKTIVFFTDDLATEIAPVAEAPVNEEPVVEATENTPEESTEETK